MRISDNTLQSKEKAAYSVTYDDDGNAHTEYNPNYKGTRVHGLPRREAQSDQSTNDQPDDSNKFDKDILDEDLHHLALSALIYYNEPITVNETLDNNLVDIRSHLAMTAISASSIRIPRNYKEAMTMPNAQGWHDSTMKELSDLKAKGVYKVVPLPKGRKTISSKLIYKAKPTPTGTLAKLKTRLVARGFQQRPGLDYDETFSPTPRSSSIRILLAICTLLGWTTDQADVFVAFLNAILKEELYCMPPPPVVLPPGHAWQLLKTLYGLVQAPRAWYETLTAKLVEMGFRVSPYNPCVYIRDIIISVHVDDIRMYAPTQNLIEIFKEELSEAFAITSEPDALYLGMHIEQRPGSITIHQDQYVCKCVDKYNYSNLPSMPTPCDHRVKLTKDDKNKALSIFPEGVSPEVRFTQLPTSHDTH
jgi:hypothetical protein